jgi:hypothetical protein
VELTNNPPSGGGLRFQDDNLQSIVVVMATEREGEREPTKTGADDSDG